MSRCFPESYPSPIDLPFNQACLHKGLQLQSPDADPGGTQGYWLVLQGSRLWLPLEELSSELPCQASAASENYLYIGRWQQSPLRLLEVPREQKLPPGWQAVDIRQEPPDLTLAQLTLAGVGRQILHWESNSRYCSRCGKPMQRAGGDWGKRCQGCDYTHYPHIHPCVIVVVRSGRRILLTRKRHWSAGRYSLVAGFLEFGESLEEAVQREVAEETGVQVRHVRYIGSQCWPFPSQLMAGFVAEYAGGAVEVEEAELEDVAWFDPEQPPHLPSKRSISRYLLDNYWLAGAASGS